MITTLTLGSAGVLLFTVPADVARILGGTLFALSFAALSPGTRSSWAMFGASTILIGAVIYGFTMDGDPAVRVLGSTFFVDGALVGALEMLRVLGLFALGVLASRLIPVDHYLPLLSRHTFPLYVTASVLRLVPALREDFDRIRRVQTARGLEPRRAWTRPDRFLPLLVPLFVNALRRARDQALALELAGLVRRRR